MKKLRVVQWTSGSVARKCVPAIVAHPDLELVGLYAWSKDKVGRDAGELCGMPALGIKATDDVAALLALQPDCVCYNALWPDVAEFEKILGAGINIVTTSMFLTGWSLSTKQPDGVPDAIARIEAAARKGNATIFGSGMNPGFASYLACILTGICNRFRHIKITESVDVSLFAADSNMDHLGWGCHPMRPGIKSACWKKPASLPMPSMSWRQCWVSLLTKKNVRSISLMRLQTCPCQDVPSARAQSPRFRCAGRV